MFRFLLLGVTCAPLLTEPQSPAAAALHTEWFVGLDTINEGGRKLQAVHYDFRAGERRIVRTVDLASSTEVLSPKILKFDGTLLRVRVKRDARGEPVGLQALPGADAVAHLLEEKGIQSMSPAIVSPDGTKIALGDHAKQQLVIAGSEVRTVPWKLSITGLFSWNPDSTRVAFYYANPARGDDDRSTQKHGLAVLGLDGLLDLVIPSDRMLGTPNNVAAKQIPPGWSPSGDFLFYTAGVELAIEPAPHASPPTAVYRLDMRTRKSTFVASGEFVDISPDGQYILVSSPVGADQAAPGVGVGTRQVFLDSGREVWLPRSVRYAQISPTGALAAAVAGAHGTVVCLDTKDWQPIGRPVPRSSKLFSIDTWVQNFRWITVGAEGWKPE